jgi:acyl-CoA reductase-like NAD-dependent aldehyde dehydrogenase
VAKGAIVAHAPPAGFYVEPHLLRDVPPDSRLGCEEVFGPVLAGDAVRDEAEAIRIANATDFGLVAGVWTENGARQLRVARHPQRQVFVNNYGAGGGVELPFGGVKHSGTAAKRASRRSMASPSQDGRAAARLKPKSSQCGTCGQVAAMCQGTVCNNL